jgi:hypothetical protein
VCDVIVFGGWRRSGCRTRMRIMILEMFGKRFICKFRCVLCILDSVKIVFVRRIG